MGRAKNTLNRSEVSSTPIKLNYSVTYESSSLGDYGITVKSGSNIPYSVNMSQNDMVTMNNYRVVRQLYYQQSITGSLGSASFWDPVWQSTAASGTQDTTQYNFPTGFNKNVLIFTLPSSQFGEQISRKSFIISSSDYYLRDDGNGNIVDEKNSNLKVGNVFYAQGVAVITEEDYSTSFNYLSTQVPDPIIAENNDDILI